MGELANHNHDYNRITPNGDDFGFYGGGGNGGWGVALGDNNNNFGRFGIKAIGGNERHNNTQPYLIVYAYRRNG